MEFTVDTYGKKYIIVSKYDGPNKAQFTGTPRIFQEFWGIPFEITKDIFSQHSAEHYDEYSFTTEDKANAVLTMLTLLRRE